MKRDALPERFFPSGFLDDLYQRYDIDPSQQEAVRVQLEASARKWFDTRSIETVADATPKETKRALAKLSRAAYTLNELLLDTPDAAWEAIVELSEGVRRKHPDIGLHHTGPRKPGTKVLSETAISVATPANGGSFQTIDVDTLIEVVAELAPLAEVASQFTSEGKQGPPPDKPLAGWIIDMRNLWHSALDRPFTRDVHEGEPVSDAARFCVDVYGFLAPNTPKSRVLNEMKKLIACDIAFDRESPDWKK